MALLETAFGPLYFYCFFFYFFFFVFFFVFFLLFLKKLSYDAFKNEKKFQATLIDLFFTYCLFDQGKYIKSSDFFSNKNRQ